MATKPRVILPNTPHHVVQRGHNRNVVFVEEADYRFYLDSLRKFKLCYGVKVYAWCLMTNHVHLILDPLDKPDSISMLMKRLAGRQTRRVNKLENRTGSLWDGRFKLSPIETDEYLLQCCRYIELNPVRAGLVADATLYCWSSFREKIGENITGILDQDESYLGLSNPKKEYRSFVEQGIDDSEYQFIRERLARNQLTGSQRFVEEVERRVGLRIESRGQGRPRVRKPDG
jgi:putative transposase